MKQEDGPVQQLAAAIASWNSRRDLTTHGSVMTATQILCLVPGSPGMRANVISAKPAATREAMPPARRSGWQSIPVPVVAGFLPGDLGGDPPGGARVQVALFEVNAPVAA